jgi:hypothetical protein
VPVWLGRTSATPRRGRAALPLSSGDFKEKYSNVALTSDNETLPGQRAGTGVTTRCLVSDHDGRSQGKSNQMVDDDRLVPSHHPFLVHQSPQRERQRTGAWITDALAYGDKVLVKHRLSARAQQSVLDHLTGAAMAALQSGQLQIIDAQQCYTDTGGDPQACSTGTSRRCGRPASRVTRVCR